MINGKIKIKVGSQNFTATMYCSHHVMEFIRRIFVFNQKAFYKFVEWLIASE